MALMRSQKKIIKTLLTFNGNQDPFSGKTDPPKKGPILNFLKHRGDFQRVILFCNDALASRADQTAGLIRESHPGIEVFPVRLHIPDPTLYEPILSELRRAFLIHCPEADDTAHYEYHISVSSGTPAMHACWLLLAASGEINAGIFHIREETHSDGNQLLITEINPRAGFFPAIRHRLTLEEALPDVTPEEMEKALHASGITGKDPALKKALGDAAQAAKHDVAVLVTGESGTGKELISRFIHAVSNRRDKAFLPVNCASVSSHLMESEFFGYVKGAFTGALNNKPGYCDTAHGGVLFLDEIGDMPMEMQAKLLRTLNDKTYTPVGDVKPKRADFRIIAATNKDLEAAVQAGLFREDLLYRINVIPIHLPPLRRRRGDIPILAQTLLDTINRDAGKNKVLTQDALDALVRYDWPGNIRELANVIQRAVIIGRTDEITKSHLQFEAKRDCGGDMALPEIVHGFSMETYLHQVRMSLYQKALEQAKGNYRAADRLLGMKHGATHNFFSKNKQA